MEFVKCRGVFRGAGLVGRVVTEHGEQDVAAVSGQAHQGGVVAFALGAFAVVVGAADQGRR